MVPITLVTGFLGAGKTTLLSHVLRNPQGFKIAVLVNDLGAVNIDAELLREASEDVVALENGCICCSLSQGLLATVAKVLRRPDPPDRILIEASGVSDPFEIAETLADPEVAPYAPLDGVVTVVDAARMAAPDADLLPLAVRQVACAGLVILNKVDLARGGDAARVWVRSVSPSVPILTAEHAVIPLPTILGIGKRADAPDHTGTAPRFESTTFRTTQPIPLHRLHALLAALPRGVVRVKGILNLADKPHHRCLVQVSGPQATITVGRRWGDDVAETRLVFIGLSGSVSLKWVERGLDLSVPLQPLLNA